ncbi:MAG: cytochrome C biogenesis protein [Actinobacteria bacterium]|nr:cytochrome C biogenesis protein [Actinomycetota bacterium]
MSVLGPLSLALLAGVLSFSSPCCLPLMPGYLSYVSGVAGEHAGAVAVRRRVVGAAALFVAGFAAVFTLLGATASLGGSFLLRNRDVLTRGAGAFVIAMGLAALGLFKVAFLYRERRPALHRIRSGPVGALPLGMAFAVGWTPCIGPVLAGILTAAATTQAAAWGALLLFVYSLGLGIPFLLLAVGYARAGTAFAWLRRHGRAIERLGGVVLVTMGILMITGQWVRLFAPLLRWFARSQWPPI